VQFNENKPSKNSTNNKLVRNKRIRGPESLNCKEFAKHCS